LKIKNYIFVRRPRRDPGCDSLEDKIISPVLSLQIGSLICMVRLRHFVHRFY